MGKSTKQASFSAMSSENEAESPKRTVRRSRRSTASTPDGGETVAHPLAVDPAAAAPVIATPPAESQQPATTPTQVAVDVTAVASSGGTKQKRFDIFITDIGWTSAVAEAVRQNIDHCLRYQANSNVYVLTQDQCMQLFRMHPSMIGTEPSVFFIDRDALANKRPGGYGFKLNFGLIRDVPTANNLLKWVMAVIAEQKPGSDITQPIKTVIHKEGLRGAVDILADITRSPVGEAMTH